MSQSHSWGMGEDTIQSVRGIMADYMSQSMMRGTPQVTKQYTDGTSVPTQVFRDTLLGLINYSGTNSSTAPRKTIRKYNDDHSVQHYDTSGLTQHARTPTGNTVHGSYIYFGSGSGIDDSSYTPIYPYWLIKYNPTGTGGVHHEEHWLNTTSQLSADEKLSAWHGLDSHGLAFSSGTYWQFNPDHVTSPDGSTPGIWRLATHTLSGGISTYTFSAIANTYQYLILEFLGTSTNASTSVNVLVTLNGDTGANYDWTSQIATQSAVTSNGAYGATNMILGTCPGASSVANCAASGKIIIAQYPNTSWNKTLRSEWSVPHDASGNFNIEHYSGLWHNTAAVTSVTIALSAGNFNANSIVNLYGSW